MQFGVAEPIRPAEQRSDYYELILSDIPGETLRWRAAGNRELGTWEQCCMLQWKVIFGPRLWREVPATSTARRYESGMNGVQVPRSRSYAARTYATSWTGCISVRLSSKDPTRGVPPIKPASTCVPSFPGRGSKR